MLDRTHRHPAGTTPTGLPPLLTPVNSPGRQILTVGIIRAGVWTVIARPCDAVKAA